MKNILVIVLMCLLASAAFSQNDSGIFLTVKCAKGTPKRSVMITNKPVCLAPNPIINITEIKSITDVKQESGKVWFDMLISEKALITLTQIAASLPNSTFALVVEKDVFYVFPASELTINRTFRFQSASNDSYVLTIMQKRIKAAISADPQ